MLLARAQLPEYAPPVRLDHLSKQTNPEDAHAKEIKSKTGPNPFGGLGSYSSDFYGRDPRLPNFRWSPDPHVAAPPTITDLHSHSAARLVQTAFGAGAQSVASYLPSLFTSLTALLFGAGGLTFWGAFRFFGSKNS